jgi:hypothetical protein
MAGSMGRRTFLQGLGAVGACTTALGGVSLLTGCEPTPPPSPTLLGTHPGAEEQATAWGRRLQDLEVFDGRVYAGYGDWGANTGPIPIDAWDVVLGEWANEGSLDTESTWMVRRVGDRLVVPFIDPKGNSGDLAVRSAGSATWTTLALGAGEAGTLHCFDAATLDGTDLWVVGAVRPGRNAAVWRSPSGVGGDWVVADLVTSVSSQWMRLVGIAPLEGRLHVCGYAMTDGGAVTPLVGRSGDAVSWTEEAGFTYDAGAGVHRVGHEPVPFDGGMVRLRSWPSPIANTASELIWFDGTSITVGPELAFAATVDHRGWLWYLDQNGDVCLRLTWAGPSNVAAPGPAGGSCLAVDGQQVYVGTVDSELYVLEFT